TAAENSALNAAGLSALLPYAEVHAAPKSAGSAVYSRFPLRDGGVRHDGVGQYRQADATLDVDGAAPVVVESVHPQPPTYLSQIPDWRWGLRDQIGADAPGPRRVLIGDFNATLDHAELRRVLDTGYRDAASEVGAGFVAS